MGNFTIGLALYLLQEGKYPINPGMRWLARPRCGPRRRHAQERQRPAHRTGYKSPKKSRSERYETACLQGMFEQYAADNTVGIMDFDEYSDKMATQEELRKQHSYFQDDVYKAQLVA